MQKTIPSNFVPTKALLKAVESHLTQLSCITVFINRGQIYLFKWLISSAGFRACCIHCTAARDVSITSFSSIIMKIKPTF